MEDGKLQKSAPPEIVPVGNETTLNGAAELDNETAEQ